MSLTGRDILKRALRLHGDLADDDEPDAAEMVSALQAFNSMQVAMRGMIVGVRLSSQPMVTSQQAENGALYQCALSAISTLVAPPNPKGGARFGVIDTANNFGTFGLFVAPNGQLLQGSTANVGLSTNGASATWFFDVDTGNWVLETDYTDIDTPPDYPERLNAYLPFMLSVFIAGEYDSALRPEIVALAQEGRAAFARSYARQGRNQFNGPLSVSVSGGAG